MARILRKTTNVHCALQSVPKTQTRRLTPCTRFIHETEQIITSAVHECMCRCNHKLTRLNSYLLLENTQCNHILKLSVLYHLSYGHQVIASLHNSQYHSVCTVRTPSGINWKLLPWWKNLILESFSPKILSLRSYRILGSHS